MLGWNFSTNASQNHLNVGDRWSASFNVVATGPPYGPIPVDACITLACRAAGSGPVGNWFTSASLRPQTGGHDGIAQDYSFPDAQVWVEYGLPVVGNPTLPPAPPAPPGTAPIVVGPAVPVISPALTAANVGVSNISLQATTAGFLGAGFVKVGMKNRPIALKVAARSGPVRSKFEDSQRADSAPAVGRFE
jgi:hypothetical protein